MNHVVVDQERCLHDGLCVSACPVSVLELETTLAGAVPTSSQGDRCIRCGHCVSICRAGALALTFLPRSDLRPMNTAHTISPEQAEQLLQARRSIRRYRDKLVPREIIARALDSARFAPSGVNRQPV
ncbi:MAG: 4Fe-4S binding protein, partial [Polyangia bacterium]